MNLIFSSSKIYRQKKREGRQGQRERTVLNDDHDDRLNVADPDCIDEYVHERVEKLFP